MSKHSEDDDNDGVALFCGRVANGHSFGSQMTAGDEYPNIESIHVANDIDVCKHMIFALVLKSLLRAFFGVSSLSIVREAFFKAYFKF